MLGEEMAYNNCQQGIILIAVLTKGLPDRFSWKYILTTQLSEYMIAYIEILRLNVHL